MKHLVQVVLATSTLLLGLTQTAYSQNEVTKEDLAFGGLDFEMQKMGTGETRQYLDRQAVFLERAQIVLKDGNFSEGVIEFDLATEEPSGFVGVNFRTDEAGNSEQFYVRFHQSDRPDATQYLATLNGSASWQLHAGPNDAAKVVLGTEQWIPIRIVVQGDKADIFVRDMHTPLLHVPLLRSDNNEGGVTFYAFDRPEMITGAYFSNLSVRPLKAGEGVTGTPREEAPVPDTVFTHWQVSDPLPESSLDGRYHLEAGDLEDRSWSNRKVENNGILNVARQTKPTQENNTVFIRLRIDSPEATSRLMRFGYSDRVRIYVNGAQQFYGNAQWRSRDHRFLGTVGLHDAVPLHLKAGENTVIAAVSESFGGWGFIGQIENRDGLAFPD